MSKRSSSSPAPEPSNDRRSVAIDEEDARAVQNPCPGSVPSASISTRGPTTRASARTSTGSSSARVVIASVYGPWSVEPLGRVRAVARHDEVHDVASHRGEARGRAQLAGARVVEARRVRRGGPRGACVATNWGHRVERLRRAGIDRRRDDADDAGAGHVVLEDVLRNEPLRVLSWPQYGPRSSRPSHMSDVSPSTRCSASSMPVTTVGESQVPLSCAPQRPASGAASPPTSVRADAGVLHRRVRRRVVVTAAEGEHGQHDQSDERHQSARSQKHPHALARDTPRRPRSRARVAGRGAEPATTGARPRPGRSPRAGAAPARPTRRAARLRARASAAPRAARARERQLGGARALDRPPATDTITSPARTRASSPVLRGVIAEIVAARPSSAARCRCDGARSSSGRASRTPRPRAD